MSTKNTNPGNNPIVAKPRPLPKANKLIARRQPDAEPNKRLTIDIPAGLHAHIKAACAMRGTKMVDEIRKLLEEKFL